MILGIHITMYIHNRDSEAPSYLYKLATQKELVSQDFGKLNLFSGDRTPLSRAQIAIKGRKYCLSRKHVSFCYEISTSFVISFLRE